MAIIIKRGARGVALVFVAACMTLSTGCLSAQTVAGDAQVKDELEACVESASDVPDSETSLTVDSSGLSKDPMESKGSVVMLSSEQKAWMEAASSEEQKRLIEYEEQLAPYKADVSLGETVSIKNIEDVEITITTPFDEKVQIPVSRFVSWTGTLDVTFTEARLFDSLVEAQEEYDLGVVLQEEAPAMLVDPKLLVTRIKVTNVDAVPGFSLDAPEEYFDVMAFVPYYPFADEAAALFSSYMQASLASFDGAPLGIGPASPYVNDFDLEEGETRVLTVGWWVDGSIDPSYIVIRPTLSLDSPGPVTFDLGLDEALDEKQGEGGLLWVRCLGSS